MLNLYISLCCQFKGALCRFNEEIRSPEHSQTDEYSVCDFNQIRKENVKCICNITDGGWRLDVWLSRMDLISPSYFIDQPVIAVMLNCEPQSRGLMFRCRRSEIFTHTHQHATILNQTDFHVWSLTHNQTVIAPPCALDSNLTANVLKDYANFGVFRIYRIHFRGSCFMWAVAALVH